MHLNEMMLAIKEQQLTRGIDYGKMGTQERIAYASHCAHALSVEVAELASSWPFAPWKTTPVDADNIEREVVDCLFFLANICACFDIVAADLEEKFQWVLRNNANRISNGEHKTMKK